MATSVCNEHNNDDIDPETLAKQAKWEKLAMGKVSKSC